MRDEDLWKKRYGVMQLTRIGGLIIALVGLLVAKGGVVTDNAYPMTGAFLVVVGIFDALLSPRILKRIFDEQDRGL
ncbi:hypothetical protein [Sphingomicrobium nitratireducens]|uniref:hypothetical protein n=1 Tax=Sphingomicrobium nitratireducens TaxID=2964666 RepID=UPI002240C948|nr:hypothetical protein [Sphingomicrobium nitratireducens]